MDVPGEKKKNVTRHCNFYIWSPKSLSKNGNLHENQHQLSSAAQIHHFKPTLSWSKFTQIIPAFWAHCNQEC